MAPLNDQNRIFGLDLMRATAILLVLAGHCAWIFPAGDTIFTALMALSGFFGVEIFFVLSGFLIGRILYRYYTMTGFTRRDVLHFLNRRWWRTLPNYFLVLTLNLIIAFFLSIPYQHLWQYFFFLQNFAWPMRPFFTESWSLSVEEFAYLILPLALMLAGLFPASKKSRRFALVTFSLILLFFSCKIAYHIAHGATSIEDWNIGLKSVVMYRLDSIFIGVFAGWLQVRYPIGWQQSRYYWLIPGVALLLFYTFGIGFLGMFIDRVPTFWNVLYLPLASVMFALFLPWLSGWKSARSHVARAVTYISIISYSMYLLHYGIVLQLMKQVVDTETLPASGAIFFTAVYLTITIVLSAFLYRFYDRPMTAKREKWRLDR